ncbi:MAG: NAD+ synthase, partial [Oscillatoria sp. Prado101]|nr:NAD+ synthase [Oscillatoria sp. Prado101]
MKIGMAQLNPIIGDLVGNAERILAAARGAAEGGCRLLLTPELSLCGYPPRDLLLNMGFVEGMWAVLEGLARDLPASLAVLVGVVDRNLEAQITGGKVLFNSMVWLENGAVRQVFHKRLLPTYDVFDEHRYFEPGGESNLLVLDGVRIGVTICEDLWNDEEFWGKRSYAVNPIADLAEIGVDLLVNLSASPYTVGKQRLREAMLEHAAVRYGLPVVYVNQVGGNDDLIFDGCSVAFGRAGEVVCRAGAFETDFSVLDFDAEKGDLLAPTIPLERGGKSAIAPLIESEDEEIWSALVLGVRDYVHKCGFSKVVLGLTGGVDSSLVAAIA